MIASFMMLTLGVICVCVAAVSAGMLYVLLLKYPDFNSGQVCVSNGIFFSQQWSVPVPDNLCAVVYDDGGCKGWKLDIQEGEIMFKWWDPVYYWYRNDIEAVSVRAGCTFTGFDDSSLNGESMTVRAGNKDRHIELNDEDEFEDFDESIQSIACTCRR